MSLYAKWKGKEVRNPLLRMILGLFGVCLGFWGVCLGLAAVALAFVAVAVIIVTVPLWLPIHFILRWSGRKGFIINHPDGKYSVIISNEGFHKA